MQDVDRPDLYIKKGFLKDRLGYKYSFRLPGASARESISSL